MKKRLSVILSALTIICLASALTQNGANAGTPQPERIEINTQNPNKVILPNPGALINSLKHVGKKIVLPEPKQTSSQDPVKVSLNAGIVMADSIACAKEQDKARMLKNTDILVQYGKLMQVDPKILAASGLIKQQIQNGQWQQVIFSLNKIRDAMDAALMKKQFVNESKLANTAGWIEGLYLASKTLANDFDAEQTVRILSYSHLPAFLGQQVSSLPANIKGHPQVALTLSTLQKIKDVIHEKKSFTKQDVINLSQISGEYRNSIVN